MEHTEEERAYRRRAEKLRRMGKPLKVTKDEFDQVVHLVELARRRGMNDRLIAHQVGLADDTSVRKIRLREYTTVRRSTYDKLMKLRPEIRVAAPHPTRGKIPAMAIVDATGTVRRMQALRRDGFTGTFLGAQLGVTHQSTQQLAKPRGGVYYTTKMEVAALYDRLADKSPEEFGIPPERAMSARTYAKRAGYAPRMCWDDDTIDDPAAFPDWTGVCGSAHGYRAHVREDIPMCDRCAPFRGPGRGLAGANMTGFSPRKFQAIRVKANWSRKRLEVAAGLSNRTISEWENGKRKNPRYGHIERALAILDATIEDVTESES